MEEGKTRDITQDHKALFELLYLTREWLNRHHYFPMHAKFALGWVYGVIECASNDRWDAILDAMREEQQTLTHRLQALEEVVEEYRKNKATFHTSPPTGASPHLARVPTGSAPQPYPHASGWGELGRPPGRPR